MLLYPIRNEADYEAALNEIERYFEHEPAPGTPEADRFDILSMLIGAYEREHWPIDAPEPIAAIQCTMEQRGYTQSDLADLLGSRSRASEILNRRRPLTMEMAWKLHRDWGLPAESLIRPYRTDTGPRPGRARLRPESRKLAGKS
jgi:HTH-type transcriptional regulator / antitoxin HigA